MRTQAEFATRADDVPVGIVQVGAARGSPPHGRPTVPSKRFYGVSLSCHWGMHMNPHVREGPWAHSRTTTDGAGMRLAGTSAGSGRWMAAEGGGSKPEGQPG